MTTIPADNTGPFSTTKVAVIAFAGAKVLLALPTSPAFIGAVLLGVTAKRLPPAARGKIRGTYAAAKQLVRTRVIATSRGIRQIVAETNARIHTKIVNGVLIITIWVAFAVEIANQIVETIKVSIEVWRSDGAIVHAVEVEA